jgi:glycerol-3-phosphate dehydrogenase (NAD(P)+)
LPATLDATVLWLCKGFQESTGALGHEIARAVPPGAKVGVLSGPSFAVEVARGQPTALVAASADSGGRAAAVAAFHHASLRIYTSADPVGVEVGGAVKNVLAIATGIADGMGLGLNARAALVTRGLAEMTRLGVALGAEAETFMGLSGLGDLVLTATGDLSRIRAVESSSPAARHSRRSSPTSATSPEGVRSAQVVLARAAACGVEMPIVAAVTDVLAGRTAPERALAQLMRREARAESPLADAG